MPERDTTPPRVPGRDDAVETGTDNIHRLDTRQAELGQDLRRLFAGLLDEDVPAELAALGAELEAKLAARIPPGPADDEASPR